jgi:hypothetical protein
VVCLLNIAGSLGAQFLLRVDRAVDKLLVSPSAIENKLAYAVELE